MCWNICLVLRRHTINNEQAAKSAKQPCTCCLQCWLASSPLSWLTAWPSLVTSMQAGDVQGGVTVLPIVQVWLTSLPSTFIIHTSPSSQIIKAEQTTGPDCYRWTTLQSLRTTHLELSADDCQIRWQLRLLQGPAKDSSVWHCLTLNKVA